MQENRRCLVCSKDFKGEDFIFCPYCAARLTVEKADKEDLKGKPLSVPEGYQVKVREKLEQAWSCLYRDREEYFKACLFVTIITASFMILTGSMVLMGVDEMKQDMQARAVESQHSFIPVIKACIQMLFGFLVNCGFYFMCFRSVRNSRTEFSHFFGFLHRLWSLMLITAIKVLGIMIPMMVSVFIYSFYIFRTSGKQWEESFDSVQNFSLICLPVLLYIVSISFMFSVSLIIDRRKGAFRAAWLSVKLVFKNFIHVNVYMLKMLILVGIAAFTSNFADVYGVFEGAVSSLNVPMMKAASPYIIYFMQTFLSTLLTLLGISLVTILYRDIGGTDHTRPTI